MRLQKGVKYQHQTGHGPHQKGSDKPTSCAPQNRTELNVGQCVQLSTRNHSHQAMFPRYAFPPLKALDDNKTYATITDELQHNVLCHLQILKDEFTCYFPEYVKNKSEAIKKLIRIPFSVKPKDLLNKIQDKVIDLLNKIQDEVIELQNANNFRNFESGLNMEELCCKKVIAYSNIWRAT
uniref:Uncharacterized protein n=1 Tax=Timema monikensis TaxID=170555 RepID=A0A7R9E916_9NEOP|nr:unnamed protein product [Timema monikensis]